MEPVFGEAYGGHRGLLSPCPLAMSPQGGRTEYDQVRQHVKRQDLSDILTLLLLLGQSAPQGLDFKAEALRVILTKVQEA